MALRPNNIFIFILIIFALTISTCHGESGYPLAAKASLLQFWRRELPNVKLPPLLMEKASPLDATSLSVFAGYIENHSITDHIASFCTAAHLLCAGDEKSGTVHASNKNYAYTKGDVVHASNKNYAYAEEGDVVPVSNKNYAYATSRTTQVEEKDTVPVSNKNYAYAKVEEGSNSQNASVTVLEEGQFFREKWLVQGSNLSLPNLSDYLPGRSFLPRSLAEKLPSFSSQSLPELMQMLRIPKNSSMGVMMAKTLQECELPAMKGEIKRCVTTVEGMAEFAMGILGAKMEVLTTWNTAGSGKRVQVGEVSRKDRGKSVSCHPSMFPYLVYYCHLVPNVRVYEASLMQNQNEKINEGVAICHMDTTDWRAGHEAFMALGHKPGEIEICHWIYQNGLVWVPLP